MNRLRWALLAIVFSAFGLSVLLTYLPAADELVEGPFGTTGTYGTAAYVALVVGATLWPRGIVWILGTSCALWGQWCFFSARSSRQVTQFGGSSRAPTRSRPWLCSASVPPTGIRAIMVPSVGQGVPRVRT
jgi:hypothetical protein